MVVTKRHDGEERISKQEVEQETTKGTHNKRQSIKAAQHCYTSHKRQSPNQAGVHASNQDTLVLVAAGVLCL